MLYLVRVAHSNQEVQMQYQSTSRLAGVNRAVVTAGLLTFAALTVPVIAGGLIVSAIIIGVDE